MSIRICCSCFFIQSKIMMESLVKEENNLEINNAMALAKKYVQQNFKINFRDGPTKHEIRANIKFCCRLGMRAAETYKLIQMAYGTRAMSRKNVFKWHSRFLKGRDSIEDDKRNGAIRKTRTKANIKKVRRIVRKNPNNSLRQIATETGLSKSTVHLIMTKNLHRQKVLETSVPEAQKNIEDEIKIET